MQIWKNERTTVNINQNLYETDFYAWTQQQANLLRNQRKASYKNTGILNMATQSYPSPVDQLLTYGNCSEIKETRDYVQELGFNSDHIDDLIRLATDQELLEANTDDLEIWAPIHAVRVLGQLRAEAAIQPLLSLLSIDDDWLANDIPKSLGMIGSAAIPAIEEYIADRSHYHFDRLDLASALTKMAQNCPEERDRCVAILTQQLEKCAEEDPEFNAGIVGELVDLKAVESAPVIESAFAAEKVALYWMGDWDEVQVSLGLKTRAEVPERQFPHPKILQYFGIEPKEKPSGFVPSKGKKQKKTSKNSKKRK
ncbi:MAG TPA: HEAT repeat domain-containing protein [Nostocaceae cyanobacterium]|nr:HEAT repeat domain-containing protein [Nostocaceae cyanobacterium]